MKFSDVVAQHEVKERLVQSAREGRLSHAQLFMGPEGSGSLPMALAFATYLVCEHPGDEDSCGHCPGCLKMSKLVHPDVTFSFPVAALDGIKKPKSADFLPVWRESVLENPYLGYGEWVDALNIQNKQGLIAVEESMDIISRLNLRAYEASYKIVIMWHADCMNTAAANKLLKVLEEPPGPVVFLLVTEHYDQLLTTILSRLQLVKVNRLPDKDLKQALVERHGLSEEMAKKITHQADGNYNEALSLIGKDHSETDLNQWFLNWMRACYSLNIEAILGISEQLAAGGREMQKMYFLHALQACRECVLINYGDKSMIRTDGNDLEGLTRLAPFINLGNVEKITGEINAAHYHIERNANSKIVFTDLSLSINTLFHVRPVSV